MTIKQPDLQQIPALRVLWKEAFGDTDAFLDTFWNTAFSADRCRCVTVDDCLAAALYWFDCEHMGNRLAYIYAVATGREYQGRGVCRALIEDTHDHLTARGYRGVVLVPGNEALFAMYAGMGYGSGMQILEFSCAAAGNAVAVQSVDAKTYGRLRRAMLPENAVIQEGENLDFLQSQAELYAGTDFLLAARREGDTLEGIELLGNKGAASGILRALGCAYGMFRMPGTGKPFAMYRALGAGDTPAPAYFGIAFD